MLVVWFWFGVMVRFVMGVWVGDCGMWFILWFLCLKFRRCFVWVCEYLFVVCLVADLLFSFVLALRLLSIIREFCGLLFVGCLF